MHCSYSHCLYCYIIFLRTSYVYNCLSIQINLRNLEKDSFWARINEEKLAKDDIFKCLMAHFSTKVIGWYELLYYY